MKGPRVVDGKIFALDALHRRMRSMGIKIAKSTLSRIFSENPKTRIDPSFKMFKSIAHALGLSLDETSDIIDRCRYGDNVRRLWGG